MSCSPTSNTRGITPKRKSFTFKKITASYFSQKPTNKGQKYRSVTSGALDLI